MPAVMITNVMPTASTRMIAALDSTVVALSADANDVGIRIEKTRMNRPRTPAVQMEDDRSTRCSAVGTGSSVSSAARSTSAIVGSGVMTALSSSRGVTGASSVPAGV
jgi:hypothetical protein